MLNWTAIFFVMLVSAYFAALAYFEKEHCKNAYISNDEFLTSLAIVRQCSVYDLFQCAGVDWRFSNSKIETDFKAYLKTGHIPQYVVAYVKQNIRPDDVKSLRLTGRLWRS
ncbi:MAG: hypothetical protein ACM3KE_03305 [Hyphomicrobiales bacterium]